MTPRLAPAVLALGLLWLGPAPVEAAPPKLRSAAAAAATIQRFERCELTIQVDGAVKNPFDPDEISIDAVFSPPKGASITVPGFYMQPYRRMANGGRETVEEDGPPVWKVRYTPRQAGRWSYEVRLRTAAGVQRLAQQPLLVTESTNKGFIQLDPKTKQFRFETGESFIPIGENVCWGPGTNPNKSYDQWLQQLALNRANYARLWFAPWGFRLETKDTKAGWYDQLRAWQVDQLFERSEAEGIYWQVCMLNHGSFSRTQDADWQNNPYNEIMGGPCRQPNDFLVNPLAKKLFERLLRYTVSRWGYSPQVASWELFNEADFGDFKYPDLVAWTGDMSQFLRSIDVNHARPLTTSFHKASGEEVWKLPGIDTVQLHVYDRRDFGEAFGSSKLTELKRTYQKPVFIGEFGWIQDVVRKFDNLGIHMHEGLWASMIGGAAGSAMIWYWDTYVAPNKLEQHFRGLEAFWRGEALGIHTQPATVSVSKEGLAGWGLSGTDRTYIWIKNRAHTVDQYIAYRCEVAKRRLRHARGERTIPLEPYAPPLIQGAELTISGLQTLGRYRIEWWDTYRGRIISRELVNSRWGKVTVTMPDVRFDIAAKLIKLQWWERG